MCAIERSLVTSCFYFTGNKFQVHLYNFSILSGHFSISSEAIRVFQGSEVRVLHCNADSPQGEERLMYRRGGKNPPNGEKQFHRCTPSSPPQPDIFLTLFFSHTSLIRFTFKRTWQASYCTRVCSILMIKLSCINGEK